jgi:HPt (histidine-containing phosphotransfer) domain-containing protein
MTEVKPKLSPDALRELRDGGDEFYREMLHILSHTLREGLQELRQYAEEKNWIKMGERAHGMRGPCSHLGITALWQLLKEMEDQSESNPVEMNMHEMLRRTEEETAQVLNELNHLLMES